MEFIHYLGSEWNVLRMAPLVFAMVLLLALLASYGLMKVIFGHVRDQDLARVAAQNERIEALKDDINRRDKQRQDLQNLIEEKNELLAQYRSKISPEISAPGHTIEPVVAMSATAFTQLTNQALRDRALQLVSQIRTRVGDAMKESRSQKPWFHQPGFDAMTEEQKGAAFNDYNEKSSAFYQEFQQMWTREFKNHAILLRDELLKRVPTAQRGPFKDTGYDHGTNPLIVEGVADDLERLAISLPV